MITHYLTWVLLGIFIYLFPRLQKYTQAHRLLIGILGLYHFLQPTIELFIAFYSGYLYEQFAFWERFPYWRYFLVFFFFSSVLTLASSFNLFRRIRQNEKFQHRLEIAILSYLFLDILFQGVPHFAFAISLIPGWHTTITNGTGIELIPIFMTGMILMIWCFEKMLRKKR